MVKHAPLPEKSYSMHAVTPNAHFAPEKALKPESRCHTKVA